MRISSYRRARVPAAIALAIASARSAVAQHVTAPHGPRAHPPTPTSAEISARDVATRAYIVADDSMQGRETGRVGAVRAARYIAAELKRLGLEPAGDRGGYLQAVPWLVRAPDTTATLTTGLTTLRWGTDFLLLPHIGFALALGGQPFGGSFAGDAVPTVYGGRIGDATIDPAAARGKVVVFSVGEPASFAFWQRDDLRRYADARAIVVGTMVGAGPAGMRAVRETLWDSTGGSAPPLTVLSMTTSAIERVFGRPIASLSIGDAGAPLSGRAAFVDRAAEAPAYNVAGIWRGADARLRDTYVAVGAHYDHVGMGPAVDHDSIRAFNSVVRPRGGEDPPPRSVTDAQWTMIRTLVDSLHRANGVRRDSIFNGADDDGSGTVLALEIAEALAAGRVRPRRSVLFVFHTAEEKGDYGSQYYSDHPTVARDSIVAQVNLDQVGRGGAEDELPAGPNGLSVIGGRRRSRELGDLVESINARPAHRFALDYTFDRDGDPSAAYCRSDHYMYARYGIPVVFFVAAPWYIDLHMVSDEPQYLDVERTARIGRLARDLVLEIANRPARFTNDRPAPDPNAFCRQ